jgi:hypothetical protein
VITQRRWQSLALAVKGRQSDLYLNGIPVSRQTWNLPITGNNAPVHLGSIQAQRGFLNAKLAAFTIYGEALSPEVVRAVYESEREAYQTRPADLFLENDLLRLKMTPGCGDESDLPGQVTVATGVTFTQEDGRPVMVFDGVTSHLIVRDNGRDRLFSRPYAFIIEVRPEPGASGALFRRHHANCFDLAKDGTLVFDANIGRNNRVSFPGAVRHGDWNRIVLVYDGRKVRLEVNGVQVGERAYEGARHDPNSDFPIVFMADNTWPGFPEARNIRGQVRELRVAPWFE